MPQAGESSFMYALAQGVRHALRRRRSQSLIDDVDLRRSPVMDQVPPPRAINPVD